MFPLSLTPRFTAARLHSERGPPGRRVAILRSCAKRSKLLEQRILRFPRYALFSFWLRLCRLPYIRTSPRPSGILVSPDVRKCNNDKISRHAPLGHKNSATPEPFALALSLLYPKPRP